MAELGRKDLSLSLGSADRSAYQCHGSGAMDMLRPDRKHCGYGVWRKARRHRPSCQSLHAHLYPDFLPGLLGDR